MPAHRSALACLQPPGVRYPRHTLCDMFALARIVILFGLEVLMRVASLRELYSHGRHGMMIYQRDSKA